MKTLRIFSFLVLSLNVAFAEGEKTFLGAIPVQYVAPGKEVVLDMHRFYQSGAKSKLDFATKDDVDLAFDAASLQLHARPKKSGLSEIVLSTIGENSKLTSVLTLASQTGPPEHHFVFKPRPVEAAVPGGKTPSSAAETAATTDRVFIGGSFNGWSKDKTPMTGPNENGEYAVNLALEPGRYAYKFVVAGAWALDPTNSQTEDNGLGDQNSVVIIAATNQSETPTIYADRLAENSLSIRAISKSRSRASPPSSKTIVAWASSPCPIGRMPMPRGRSTSQFRKPL